MILYYPIEIIDYRDDAGKVIRVEIIEHHRLFKKTIRLHPGTVQEIINNLTKTLT